MCVFKNNPLTLQRNVFVMEPLKGRGKRPGSEQPLGASQETAPGHDAPREGGLGLPSKEPAPVCLLSVFGGNKTLCMVCGINKHHCTEEMLLSSPVVL